MATAHSSARCAAVLFARCCLCGVGHVAVADLAQRTIDCIGAGGQIDPLLRAGRVNTQDLLTMTGDGLPWMGEKQLRSVWMWLLRTPVQPGLVYV